MLFLEISIRLSVSTLRNYTLYKQCKYQCTHNIWAIITKCLINCFRIDSLSSNLRDKTTHLSLATLLSCGLLHNMDTIKAVRSGGGGGGRGGSCPPPPPEIFNAFFFFLHSDFRFFTKFYQLIRKLCNLNKLTNVSSMAITHSMLKDTVFLHR